MEGDPPSAALANTFLPPDGASFSLLRPCMRYKRYTYVGSCPCPLACAMFTLFFVTGWNLQRLGRK